jgi:hypothetical protein
MTERARVIDHPGFHGSQFDQGVWWKTKDDGWMRITDMEPSHRANAARFLLRRAEIFKWRHEMKMLGMLHDAPDDVVDSWLSREVDQSPADWMHGTTLFRAMRAALAPDTRIDDVQAAVSRRDAGARELIVPTMAERLAEARTATSVDDEGDEDWPDDRGTGWDRPWFPTNPPWRS